MKTTPIDTEIDNLVMFPSSKNFRLDDNDLSDPIMDLLN